MLVANWKKILRKAKSVRLILLAGLLSGTELILPLYINHFPRGVFAGITVLVTIAALVARITAQKEFNE